jgi:K+-sensing histidine kinase KdpD
MISYLGYPIILPTGEVFGTLCVLDTQENKYNESIKKLMMEFKELIETHLELVHKNRLLKKTKKKYRRAYKRTDLYKNFLIHDVNNILQNLTLSIGIIRDARKKKILNEEKVSKVLDILDQDVINGKNLISNIRLLSKIPKENSNIKEVEFFGILEKAINQIIEMYPPNSLDITLLTKTQISGIYVTASELLSSALKNVLLNAIKHNDNPIKKIQIKCSIVDFSQDKFLKVEFIDNGIGIPDKRKEAIFDHNIFQEEKKKGLGIGLTLVHKLITSYGGKIWVENRIKDDYTQGSNFIISLPIIKKNQQLKIKWQNIS